MGGKRQDRLRRSFDHDFGNVARLMRFVLPGLQPVIEEVRLRRQQRPAQPSAGKLLIFDGPCFGWS